MFSLQSLWHTSTVLLKPKRSNDMYIKGERTWWPHSYNTLVGSQPSVLENIRHFVFTRGALSFLIKTMQPPCAGTFRPWRFHNINVSNNCHWQLFTLSDTYLFTATNINFLPNNILHHRTRENRTALPTLNYYSYKRNSVAAYLEASTKYITNEAMLRMNTNTT